VSGKVVHILSGAPYDVYVGRAMPRYGLPKSIWANPYRIGVTGPLPKVLRRYEKDLRYWMKDTPGANPAPEPWNHRANLIASVVALRGKTLACWCCDKSGPPLTVDDPVICHAQILLKLAEEMS
jgi:hypothetical protein